MLKKRIAPLLLWDEGRLVKTLSMRSPRVVGDPVRTCKVYSDQDADEIILLEIGRNESARPVFLESLRRISSEIMMPVTVGGGVTSLDRARLLFDSGADKVLVNSAAYSNTKLLEDISSNFGSQALVVAVDFERGDAETPRLYSESGSRLESVTLLEHLRAVEGAGAGEILIQSTERDGTRIGLDLEVIRQTLEISSLPVVACGGVGNFMHLLEAFELGVDGVGCGTLFNFGDNNPIRAKSYLRNHAIDLKRLG